VSSCEQYEGRGGKMSQGTAAVDEVEVAAPGTCQKSVVAVVVDDYDR
jgi:hypothetical protein